MKKEPNHLEGITIPSLYIASKHIQQKLTEPEGEVKKFTRKLAILSHSLKQLLDHTGKKPIQRKSEQQTNYFMS